MQQFSNGPTEIEKQYTQCCSIYLKNSGKYHMVVYTKLFPPTEIEEAEGGGAGGFTI